jgi:hypothetical protein
MDLKAFSAERGPPLIGLLLVIGAATVAIAGAYPYAGSWQDGSRLANVEALVDYHTWAIDDSIFVRVPAYPPGRGPYPPNEPALLRSGTKDKLLIGGHYYTDRPVPALLMAGVYQCYKWCEGETARARPDAFCRALTFGTAGLAYVIAVWCIYRLGLSLGLALATRLLLAGSFAVATVALTYTRQVNVHMMLLAIAAALFRGFAQMADRIRNHKKPWLWLCWLGSLAGLGYTCDLGAGPVLLLCSIGIVAYRCRPIDACATVPVLAGLGRHRLKPELQRMLAVALFVLAALPWLALHHAINFAIGGTFRPINSVPEYSVWPGSPFTAENLTGVWNHGTFHFVVYAVALLAGKRGFLGHNLPLCLVLPGMVMLWRRRPAGLAEAVIGCFWSAGTWLLYAALSTNSSGVCCSVRWFVPLLAPAYYILALVLREYPSCQLDLCVLSGWGAVIAGLAWWHGPWMKHMVPYFWPIQVGSFASWYACRRWYSLLGRRGVPWSAAKPRTATA